ncbi:MAG: hypothetical protein Q7S12_01710 [bacterium]|nr:hypothetical protein [bacterium]
MNSGMNQQFVDFAFFPATREGHGGISEREVKGRMTTCRMGCDKNSEQDSRFHFHSKSAQGDVFLGITKKRKKVANRTIEEAMKALGGVGWSSGGHAGSGGEILPLALDDKVRIVLTPLQIKHGAHEEYPIGGEGVAIGRVHGERLIVVRLNKLFTPKMGKPVTMLNVPASCLQRA